MTEIWDDEAVDNADMIARLLPRKTRQRVEIWIDEIVQLKEANECTSDKVYGHVSDAEAEEDRWPSTDTMRCPICQHPYRCRWSRRLRRDSSPPASPRGSSLDKDEPWRAKSVFQKLKDALMALRLNIIGHDEIDPLIATKMYHVPTSDKDASNEGGHPPSEAESLASSEGNGGLDARVARLRRAQRLLQRNQPMEGAGQYREVTVSRKV